jgi:putative salt-induced outer membrane protein YdiY
MLVRASCLLVSALALSLALAARAGADEIQLLNGDRLTGKILKAEGGKVVIKTEAAGEVTVDLSKVKTISTDEPILVKSGDTTFKSKLEPGADGTVQVVPVEGGPAQTLALKDLTQLNPPPVQWTGAITINGLITQGNSESQSLGASANAVRRSEIDRITLGGAYYYGRQKSKDTGEWETNVNNWYILGKYDYFLTKHFYLYAAARVEQDHVADLDLRLTAGPGVGYQWFETPTLNLFTEAGLAWVYENFSEQPSEDHLALRLAYHVDWTPHKMLKLFHNLEYLPNVTEPFVDYNLNLDAGLRATVIADFFAELKFEFRYDSTPAIDKKKEDLRFLVGVGWSF